MSQNDESVGHGPWRGTDNQRLRSLQVSAFAYRDIRAALALLILLVGRLQSLDHSDCLVGGGFQISSLLRRLSELASEPRREQRDGLKGIRQLVDRVLDVVVHHLRPSSVGYAGTITPATIVTDSRLLLIVNRQCKLDRGNL